MNLFNLLKHRSAYVKAKQCKSATRVSGSEPLNTEALTATPLPPRSKEKARFLWWTICNRKINIPTI